MTRLTTFLLAVLVVTVARGLSAQATDVLKQLTSVNVRVRLEGAARGFPALEPERVEADIRERLNAAGLQVVDVTSGAAAGQAPIFEVFLVMYADSARARRYAFNLTATLTEGVTLRRGDPRRVWAQTWNGPTTVGIVGADGAALLEADVRGLVENFVRDYQAANDGTTGRAKREALAPGEQRAPPL
jgi:hypothetical protein